MKKTKLFGGIMLMLLGMNFMACGVNDSEEDNSTVSELMVARYNNGENCLYDINGVKMIPNDASMMYTVSGSGLYQFTVRYNPTKVSGGQINVDLVSSPESIMNKYGLVPEPISLNEGWEPLSLYMLSNSMYGYRPVLFGKDYLLLPVMFWGPSIVNESERKDELARHAFVLSYEEFKPGDESLVFHLTDYVKNAGDTRRQNYLVNEGFYIGDVVNQFKAAGNSLKQIVFVAMTSSGNYEFERGTEERYTLEYKE